MYDFGLEKTPDMKVLLKKFRKNLELAEPKPMRAELKVGNTDRAFGTIFGSEITARFAILCPTIPSMCCAAAAAVRASAHFCPRA